MNWQGKKVLAMEKMYFLLPDDFDGDLNDALLELVKYRKEKGFSSPSVNEKPSRGWDRFVDAVENGFRLDGGLAFVERNNNEWVEIGYDVSDSLEDK